MSDQRAAQRRTRLGRIGRVMATGGLSLIFERTPKPRCSCDFNADGTPTGMWCGCEVHDA